MFFSVIIPVKSINSYVHENINKIRYTNFEKYEVLIVTNEAEQNPWKDDSRIKLLVSGRVSPGRKRDLAATVATGDILVFFDDDSYPAKNFFEVCKREFQNEHTIAIGGPGITPPENSLKQRLSGAFFLSRFAGGAPERYQAVGERKTVTEWPSVNISVRKSTFLSVSGFDNDLWPGEDTILCSKLNQRFGKLIQYVPDLVVYHHRRKSVTQHLHQVFSYGRQRGYLFKKRDPSSKSLLFFLPTCLLLYIPLSIWAFFHNYDALTVLVLALWSCYLCSIIFAMIEIKRFENWTVTILSSVIIFISHIAYGLGTLVGFWCRRPKVFLR